MNVFADRHHSDLACSLLYLFSIRLNHRLFFPIGMEWYEQGYWNVYPHIDTAKQYLQIGNTPQDKTLPLNDLIGPNDGNSPFIVEDKHNDKALTCITLEQFKNIPIDIIIASIPQHIKPYKELAKMKNAKFIFQMGNVFPEVVNNLHEIPNLMANTLPPHIPHTCNAIQYHQEFSTNIFKPSSMTPQKRITSLINIYHNNKGFEDFMTLKSMMPDYEFKSFGAQNQDGILDTTQDIASEIHKAQFGFHSKYMGDGFGHALYNWYACGKPVITRISDYKGKLGEELLENNVTCLDLDNCNYHDIYDRIINMSPQEYAWMCSEAEKRFKECVDYDKEEQEIREFLERLK